MAGLTDLPSWHALSQRARVFQQPDFRLDSLFTDFPGRFQHYSLQIDQLLIDYSKNYVDDQCFESLMDLAVERGVSDAIAAMFAGEKINNTEVRPALHVALRQPDQLCRFPEVAATLARMETFTEAIRSGQWRGHKDDIITDVVNIGIGGSDLGPAMVCEALAEFHQAGLKVHFVSNVDPVHLNSTLAELTPATTLFIVASKSFTTLETRQNAESAKRWLLASGADQTDLARHFVAITTNRDAATDFGIDPDNLFPLWDWVGGRYSLWSAIGLPVALAIGMDRFRELLAGAHAMDLHFRDSPLEHNAPVILALLSVFYSGLFEAHSTAVVPYSQRLAQFPAFLQQLYMESLGKRVHKDGAPLEGNSGEVLWGTAGTNGQHSYFQLLHQGTEFIPVDFIACAAAESRTDGEGHRQLLANCLSQSLALMSGTPQEDNPHQQVPGNKPSTTILLSRLNPYNLGALIALYEHRVYVQSIIWDINAFDQWGVELGKALSRQLYDSLSVQGADSGLDASSAGLIEQINRWNKT